MEEGRKRKRKEEGSEKERERKRGVRERERERECVCVCVCARGQMERNGGTQQLHMPDDKATSRATGREKKKRGV